MNRSGQHCTARLPEWRPPLGLRDEGRSSARFERVDVVARTKGGKKSCERRWSSVASEANKGRSYPVSCDAHGCQIWRSGTGPTKRVIAKANVVAPLPQVWRALTDYDALPSFVPDLVVSEVLPDSREGRLRLRQRARNGGAYWSVEAEGVVEVEEVELSTSGREIRFHLVKGDFTEYYGRWIVEPSEKGDGFSVLEYDAVVVLKEDVPDALFDHAVRAWLPGNIEALKNRAEEDSRWKGEALSSAGRRTGVGSKTKTENGHENCSSSVKNDGSKSALNWRSREDQLPWKRTARRMRMGPVLYEGVPSEYLGTTSVPLPPFNPSVDVRVTSIRQQIAERRKDKYPDFNPPPCSTAVSEVHIRKLDTWNFVHRRVVATTMVKAPVEDVWQLITDYGNLADFVPNLAVSEIVDHPQGAPAGYWRIRQVAVKSKLGIEFRVESILDIVEKPMNEIQFRQRHGLFDKMQGKWILSRGDQRGASTELKYAVEVKMPVDRWQMKLVEPTLEQCAVEDIPKNLEAIKHHVEQRYMQNEIMELRTAGEQRKADALERQFQKPKTASLMSDFSVLVRELKRCYGDSLDGYLPTRSDLRRDSRTDIEKAITAHGGPSAVAEKMGWQLKTKGRKPRGYWDDPANLLQEIENFNIENDLQPSVMPRKVDFVKAGRHDLRRAVERWGGIYELANRLGLEVPSQGGDREFAAGSAAPKLAAELTGGVQLEIRCDPMELANNGGIEVDSSAWPSEGPLKESLEQDDDKLQEKMNINLREVDLFDGTFIDG